MVTATQTQRDYVLRRLTDMGEMGVCGTTFLRGYVPRYAARIYELRKAGHTITRISCTLHNHETPQYRYVLEDGTA